MTRIEALALSTRLLSERAHMIGIIECCLLSIRAKDDQLPQIVCGFETADREMIDTKLDAQDTRLAEAIANLAAPAPGQPIPEPPHAALHHQLSTIN